MSGRCRACSIGLHCGLCDCCPSRKAPEAELDETRTARLPRARARRDLIGPPPPPASDEVWFWTPEE